MLFSLDSICKVAKNRVTMKIVAYAKTDVGRKRKINQDSVLVNSKHHIYAVADGMGGHKGGEVASAMAVEAIQEVLAVARTGTESIEEKIELAYRLANERIYTKSHDPNFADLEGMGTTLVALVATEKKIYISNVGDSRAYMFSDGKLWQMTEDHSLVQEQFRAGLVSNENSAEGIGKNVITRSVGYESYVKSDIIYRDYVPGEVYLLCSDGLSGLISNHEIAKIISENPLDKVANICVEKANEAGGSDNISCLVVSLK